MRNAVVAVSSFFSLLCLPAEEYPPTDIKTIYGQTFKNAQIVNLNKATVDITYLDSNNVPVMRGVKLRELTPDLQEKFGYDPVSAAENERRETLLQQNRFDHLKQQELQLWQKLSLQIQQRQSGQNVPVDINELYQAVYSTKSAITGFVVTLDQSGALVNVTGDNSEMLIIPDNIIILDLNAPARSNWTGYIYPTMMINPQHLPVYCINPENAISSVITTLKLDRDITSNNIAADLPPTSTPVTPASDSSDTYIPNSTGTYEYTTVYVQNGGYCYPSYPSGIWRWPTCIRPYPPCPPRHGGCNGNWHSRHNGNNENSASRWVRRTDRNGAVKWVNRARANGDGRNSQAGRGNPDQWGQSYNRSAFGQSSGSRWARRTEAENNGRPQSLISGNNKLDNLPRRINSGRDDGKAWVRYDGQSNGDRQPKVRVSHNNACASSGGRRPGVIAAGNQISAAARARAAAPFTGSGFTGGTVGGSWGGGAMSR